MLSPSIFIAKKCVAGFEECTSIWVHAPFRKNDAKDRCRSSGFISRFSSNFLLSFCSIGRFSVFPPYAEHEITLSDRPGQPEKLGIVDVDKNYIKIGWKPPLDDGKAPITHYIVERREHSQKEWFAVGIVAADKLLILKDDKVVEGHEYYYRVCAVNKAGPGEACDCTRPSVKAKAKPG